MSNNNTFAFFGGEPLSVPVLEELKAAGLTPSLIVANPDKATGRKQTITSPPVKEWAIKNDIEVFQPESYEDTTTREKLESRKWDFFVVVAYNFILPEWVLQIPEHGAINLHPSLLPKLRGASPIRSAILLNRRDDIGATVMLLDEKMDHGPILDQIHMSIPDEKWPVTGPELDLALARMGGSLLAEVIPNWVTGNIEPQEQAHEAATYCKKFEKTEQELTIDPLRLPTNNDAWEAWLKINAFTGIGGTFFTHQKKRVKIKEAEFYDKKLRLLRVTPEGKNEMDFSTFVQSIS